MIPLRTLGFLVPLLYHSYKYLRVHHDFVAYHGIMIISKADSAHENVFSSKLMRANEEENVERKDKGNET